MSLAVREVSVAKGYDPRDFALVASGGAGPLHVCAIARELYIPTVIVPLFPSHFSALGMLLADERHDFTRTVYSDLASVDFAKLVAVHDEMVADAKAQPAPRQERAVPDPSRPALHGPGVHAAGAGHARPAQEAATARRSAPRSTSSTSSLRAPFAGRAGRDGQHPARRHRQAAEAAASRASASGGARRARRRARRPISPRRASRSPPRSIAARRWARARRSPGRR